MIRFLLCFLVAFGFGSALASSEFTYQGRLMQSGQSFEGSVNLVFRLYGSLEGSDLIGEQLRPGWPVQDGLFQVTLDFGPAAFSGGPRFLEVRVDGVPLSPRQAVHPAPIALFALDGNPGPQGQQGPPGPVGQTGPPGPGPTMFTFPAHNYSTSASYFVNLAGLGPQVNDVMIWVYLVDTSTGVIYPIPGKGISGNSDYRVWWLSIGSSISVRTQRAAGPGENYGEVRVLVVPISG